MRRGVFLPALGRLRAKGRERSNREHKDHHQTLPQRPVGLPDPQAHGEGKDKDPDHDLQWKREFAQPVPNRVEQTLVEDQCQGKPDPQEEQDSQ